MKIVNTKNYSIFLNSDIKILSNHIPLAATLVIITDNTIKNLYLSQIKSKLNNFKIIEIIIPKGDNAKNFTQLELTLNKLSEAKINKKDFIISLGGGAIGDLAALVASLYMRGIGFINIPTTLLAQIDASIGGKTAINTKFGKNIIGSFYNPKLVITNSYFLNSLSEREFSAGYAEIIKYGLINDTNFFSYCEQHYQDILIKNEALNYAIETSIKHKLKIVQDDLFEKGNRALLNLGHSFAHALEKFCNYNNNLLHGEAVAIGLALAFEFSAYLNLCSEKCSLRITQHLKQVNLPFSLQSHLFSDLSPELFLELMEYDKKNTHSNYNLILAKDIGKAFFAKNISSDLLLNFLRIKLDKKKLIL